MEIELLHPHTHPKGSSPIPKCPGDKPFFGVDVRLKPSFYIWADIVLTNHRTDRKERIIGCSLVVKKRYRILWSKTIAQTEVKEEDWRGREPKYIDLVDVELEPMSGPKVITVRADGWIEEPIESLPDRMTLMLEFKMVGPTRKYTHKLKEYKMGNKKNKGKPATMGVSKKDFHRILDKASKSVKKFGKEKS